MIGETDRGEAIIHINIVWDLFFSKYIYLGPGPDQGNKPLAEIHQPNSNYAFVFLSVKYKSHICPAYL